MFKQILANLPFNPSLIDHLSFYYGRLKKEAAIRRLGFVMMAMALFINILAALYPPQVSLAYSPNDILDGITNKSSILRAYDANTRHIRDIYQKFGITRDNIQNIQGQKPNATISSTGRDFWSVGRLPLSTFGISGAHWGERTVNVDGTKIYQRPLHAWDSGGSTRYQAFHGINKYGKDFWILKTCGNPTFVGPYLPSPPKPKLKIHKTLMTNSVVRRNELVKFKLEYRNTVEDSLATHFKIQDTLDSNFEFVSMEHLAYRNGNTVTITRSGHIGYSRYPYTSVLTVKVKPSAKHLTTICNSAKAASDQSTDVSENPCITVVVPSSAPQPTQATAPGGYCIASSSSLDSSGKNFRVRTQSYTNNGTKVTGYSYDIDANGSIDYKESSAQLIHEKNFNNLGAGSHTIRVYVQFKNSAGSTAQSKYCIAQFTVAEESRVDLSKSVTNVTTGKDANNTTVKSGDLLDFSLVTSNITSSDYKNYNGEDYFGSVMQYADIVDKSQLTSQGITLDKDNYLHWDVATIKAKTSDTKTIRVKVKKIIPVTNSPSKLSPDYNCKISNDYGNEVNMDVSCPLVKGIEQTATTLPNTGPGSAIAIGSLLVGIAGYLYMRSRIMAKELVIIRNEYTSSGGF